MERFEKVDVSRKASIVHPLLRSGMCRIRILEVFGSRDSSSNYGIARIFNSDPIPMFSKFKLHTPV